MVSEWNTTDVFWFCMINMKSLAVLFVVLTPRQFMGSVLLLFFRKSSTSRGFSITETYNFMFTDIQSSVAGQKHQDLRGLAKLNHGILSQRNIPKSTPKMFRSSQINSVSNHQVCTFQNFLHAFALLPQLLEAEHFGCYRPWRHQRQLSSEVLVWNRFFQCSTWEDSSFFYDSFSHVRRTSLQWLERYLLPL